MKLCKYFVVSVFGNFQLGFLSLSLSLILLFAGKLLTIKGQAVGLWQGDLEEGVFANQKESNISITLLC